MSETKSREGQTNFSGTVIRTRIDIDRSPLKLKEVGKSARQDQTASKTSIDAMQR
jgi:hypothetical protein